MKSTLLNMVLVLLAITLVGSAAVGVVYQATKEPIRLAKEEKLKTAIGVVMPQFEELGEQEILEINGGKITIYPAMNGSDLVGYAVETFSKNGFGGEIKIMVGFLPDGTINNTAVVSQHETPGLGDKMDISKSDFPLQFKGKNPASYKLSVTKDGGDIDAITAATISSRAFADALRNGYEAFKQINK